MATSSSSTKQQSSRFSSFKVFKFTSSKPPPPPPKDPGYIYSASCNPSLASVSNHSLYSQPSLPPSSSAPSPPPSDKTKPNGTLSIRSASPTPSRVLQPSPQHRQQQQHPPSSLSASSTLMPDSNLGTGKVGFFRKMSTLGKRSASKSRRVTTPDDVADGESISRPWNVQHHIHIDETFQGIPPAWTSTLAGLGYSEAEIALILKGRRNRVPDPTSVQDDPSSSTNSSRSRSPSTTISVNRSTSLRRQRSDGSIARSERSLRIGPPVPPPPLPLPPPPMLPLPQSSQAPKLDTVPPVAPPPTPTSTDGTSVEAGDVEVASSSEAQYVYVNHPLHTPEAVPPLGKVPVIQPAPVRQQHLNHSNSSSPVLEPPSASVNSKRLRPQPSPRRQFRVVNGTSPPPVYSDDSVPSGSPPPITLEDALQPRLEEKSPSQHSAAPSPTPTNQVKTPPPNSPPVNGTRHRRTEKGQEDAPVRSSNERYRSRPSDLSILPPRVSLRKDTLEDLSSWSASLFSSLPSALHDSPVSSVSTAPTSAATSQVPQQENTKHRTKPSLSLPTIVLHPEVREEDEDERENDGEGEDEEDATGNEYSHSASPLYHELMGMMQERASVSNNDVGSPGPGSPASLGFQLDTASLSSHGTSSRDSQLTIRFNSGDSNRDSSASISTLTHATIVRGASIARRARADVVTTPRSLALFKGKERTPEQASVPVVEEDVGIDEDEGDSSSDAAGSDEDGGSGSPVDSFAFTSGPDSQEDDGNKSPRRVYVHGSGSLLPSPLSSPLRACFPESGSEEPQSQHDEQTQKESTQVLYVTPPPSIPVTVPRSPIAIATDLENLIGIPASSLSSPPTEQDGPVLETSPRYPSWLAASVLPLAEFIDDSSDPRALFTDLQEIAQGESGSVYSACAAPTVASQFRPPTPTSPVSEISPEEHEADEGLAQPRQGLVAIKCVPLLRGHTEKLADLRRELELSRALRHANVLRMERLYVDVAEESLWIGMELMDRSLADVLAVVGEEVESALVAPEAQEEGTGDDDGSCSGPGGGAEVVEILEKMVARFVRDVLLALSYIRKHHIAHRDVRSDNLLLSRSGVLKLSDFSNAVCSPPGTPKRSDSVGVIYWQAPEMRTGLYDPLKVDVWSLGATTWELVHGVPPFEDVKDTRDIVGGQLPPVREPDAFSRSFHDFLHLCSQPAASRPDSDELLDAEFVRTACPRSEIVRLLGQCKAIDEQQIRRQSNDL